MFVPQPWFICDNCGESLKKVCPGEDSQPPGCRGMARGSTMQGWDLSHSNPLHPCIHMPDCFVYMSRAAPWGVKDVGLSLEHDQAPSEGPSCAPFSTIPPPACRDLRGPPHFSHPPAAQGGIPCRPVRQQFLHMHRLQPHV